MLLANSNVTSAPSPDAPSSEARPQRMIEKQEPYLQPQPGTSPKELDNLQECLR